MTKALQHNDKPIMEPPQRVGEHLWSLNHRHSPLSPQPRTSVAGLKAQVPGAALSFHETRITGTDAQVPTLLVPASLPPMITLAQISITQAQPDSTQTFETHGA